MTTTTTAASNGSTDTDTTAEATGQKDKPFGMAKVRETDTYHTTSVLAEAVSEADRLCMALQHAVSDAYFADVRKDKKGGNTGLTATQTVESSQMQVKIQETVNCLNAAGEYARRLLVNTYQPPF